MSLAQNHQPRTVAVDYAILTAMPEELEFYREMLSARDTQRYHLYSFEMLVCEYKNKKILLACTGLGTTFAASMLTLIYHHFAPDYVLFSGTAGSIDPQVKLREVVIAEHAFEAEIQGVFEILEGTPFASCLTHPMKMQKFPAIYAANEELLQIAAEIPSAHPVHKGTVVSSNTFPAPQELFEKIKSKAPCCIDMESSAIYQTAWLLNIPALVVRGISNILNHDGSDDNVHTSDVKGSAAAAAKLVLNIIDCLAAKHSGY